MKKIFVAVALCLCLAQNASADNVGGCGWGSKLFDGQKGVFPQILAVTTNGTSGNQTFGISSGTSGCTQDGVVSSRWKTAAFIDSNMNKLAQDISRGEGETIDSLGHLAGVQAEDKAKFAVALKDNFGKIFSSENVTSADVAGSIRGVLASDETLARYAAAV